MKVVLMVLLLIGCVVATDFTADYEYLGYGAISIAPVSTPITSSYTIGSLSVLPQPFIYGSSIGCYFSISSTNSTANLAYWMERGDGFKSQVKSLSYVQSGSIINDQNVVNSQQFTVGEYWRCAVNITSGNQSIEYSDYKIVITGSGGGTGSGGIVNITINPTNITNNVTQGQPISTVGLSMLKSQVYEQIQFRHVLALLLLLSAFYVNSLLKLRALFKSLEKTWNLNNAIIGTAGVVYIILVIVLSVFITTM